MQARFQEELHWIVDIQFLGKGCYHVEFPVVDMVMKLLRLGSTRINGILLHFLQWEPGFDLNVVSEQLSHYFVFSVMFPALPKEWKPVMPYMASTIAQLLDEESDVVRYVAGNFNLPYIRLIGHKGMTLPSYVRLPAMFQAPERVQKVKYSGLPNQCFVCNRIGHVVKDCPVRNEQNLQKRFSSNTNDEGWIEGRRKHDRKSSVRTANGIGITSSKRSHATDDDSQLNKTNLQIIPFNNSDVQLHREEDYNIVIDHDIVKSMTDKPLKGGNDHEHITTFESSALQGESHMELAVVEKNEEVKL